MGNAFESLGWNSLSGIITAFSIGDLFTTIFSSNICSLSAETLAVDLAT